MTTPPFAPGDKVQLARLKAVAEKPLRVRWAAAYHDHADYEESATVVQLEKQHMRVCFPTSDGDPAIMEHIATFDPPTVLALIAEIERLSPGHLPASDDGLLREAAEALRPFADASGNFDPGEQDGQIIDDEVEVKTSLFVGELRRARDLLARIDASLKGKEP